MAVKKRTDKDMPPAAVPARLDWEDLRYFVALAQHGSLSATARALKVNHATVARRLAALEERLERNLFDRRADGYVPNAAGLAALESARRMEEAAIDLLHQVERDTMLSGRVRLTTTRAFADSFLAPRLAPFAARHPQIELELIGESRNMSLTRREADLALRLGRPRDGDFTARQVATLAFQFYAAPSYLKRRRDATEHSFITFDEENAALPEAQHLRRLAGKGGITFRSNSQIAQAAAARAGFGLALLPCYLARGDGGLVAVPLDADRLRREVWMLIRRDLARVPRIRLVADHLAGLLKAGEADLLDP